MYKGIGCFDLMCKATLHVLQLPEQTGVLHAMY
jgi:hypothetical protein